MIDNEIIKALECCTGLDHFKCAHCHLMHTVGCSSKLKKYALDLINRQKAEIERLKEEKLKVHQLIPRMIKTAKAEAVKEFAERLKNLDVDTHYSYASIVYELSEDDIDNLVKEMAGEQE